MELKTRRNDKYWLVREHTHMLTYDVSAGDGCMEKTHGVRMLERGMRGYGVITSHRGWTEQDPLTSVWNLLWTPPWKPFFSKTDPTDAQKFLVYLTHKVIHCQHTPPLSETVIFSNNHEMCPHQMKSRTWRSQMLNTNKSHRWSQGMTEFTQLEVHSFLQSLCSCGLFQSYSFSARTGTSLVVQWLTPCFHYRGCGFSPWSENSDPRMMWGGQKI